ncbi:ESX secretion-associated protein EspG [Rhodococcus qingshengii]|uniref:ESX secretion-associated protein EspG n=1 Tax=Rhodococcus qingshengii TaxID=334542 RepID=UPI0036DCCC63
MVDLGTSPEGWNLPVVALSQDEIDYLRERLGLDGLPVVLGGATVHGSASAHRTAMQSAADSLSERDLLPGGEIHHDLSARLRVLTRPKWELALRRHVGGSISRLCVAQGEFLCVEATSTDSSFALRSVTTEPAAPVVTALGSAEAMPIAVINAPTEMLSLAFGAGPDAGSVTSALINAGIPEDDARQLGSAIVSCTAFAELVGIPHSLGATTLMTGAVTVYDTLSGRLVGSTTRAADGTEWTSISSGTSHRLRQAVNALVTELEESAPETSG